MKFESQSRYDGHLYIRPMARKSCRYGAGRSTPRPFGYVAEALSLPAIAILGLIIFLGVAAPRTSAQTGGCHLVTIRSGTDNYISIPFQRDPAASARVASVGSTSLGITGAAWNRDQFARIPGVHETTYYVQFTTGKLEGIFYKILSNTTDTLVLATEGDDLTNHPAGAITLDDVVEIRPYWTLATVFGATASELVIAPRPNAATQADEVLLPDNLSVGTGSAKSAAGGTYYFLIGAGWRRQGDTTTTDQAPTILPPGQMLTVRRRAAGDIELLSIGEILQNRVSVFVQGGDGVSGTDSYLGLTQPLPVTLNQSTLVDLANPTASAVRPSPTRFQVLDQVLVFPVGALGYNVLPSRSFYYLSGQGWRESGSTATNTGDTVSIFPGEALIVRKAKTSGGADWLQPR